MAERTSFVLYKSWINEIRELTDKEAGNLIMDILRYVNGKQVQHQTDLLERIIDQIEYEWSKFNPKTNKYHWNYKGGITPENRAIRNSSLSGWWRVRVFERDDYTCQDCGQRGGILNAHHIKEFAKYPELRFDVSNGVTLCKSCHIKVHKKSTYATTNTERLD